MLLELGELAVCDLPDMHHLDLGRLARGLVVPRVASKCDDGVAVGDDLGRDGREVVADLAEAQERTSNSATVM